MKLEIKVVPGSFIDSIAGWLGTALKVKVRAKPENGKANKAVEKLMAKTLDWPVRKIRIVSGTTSARKTLEIQDMETAAFRERLTQVKP